MVGTPRDGSAEGDLREDAGAGGARSSEAPVRTGNRGVVAVLIVLSSLYPVLFLGSLAGVSLAGPELFAEAPGGGLDVIVTPMCDDPHRPGRACFTTANVTFIYASGAVSERAMQDGMFSGSIVDRELAEARVTVQMRSDLGFWEREFWVPKGIEETFLIEPDTPKTVDGVVGRQVGLGVLGALGTLFGVSIIVGALVWWVRRSMRAAVLTRAGLTAGIVMQLGFVLAFGLGTGSIPFLQLLIVGWTWFLRAGVARWIREATPPSVTIVAPVAAEGEVSHDG